MYKFIMILLFLLIPIICLGQFDKFDGFPNYIPTTTEIDSTPSPPIVSVEVLGTDSVDITNTIVALYVDSVFVRGNTSAITSVTDGDSILTTTSVAAAASIHYAHGMSTNGYYYVRTYLKGVDGTVSGTGNVLIDFLSDNIIYTVTKYNAGAYK